MLILFYELLEERPMKPIVLEVVTKMLTTYSHCRHCEVFFDGAELTKKFHQQERDEYPADLKEEMIKLSEWIRELTRLYKHRLLIKLIDVQSFIGIYKSLRHRIRTYPTFIIEGKEIYAGWDKNHLEDLLDRYIKASLLPKSRSAQPTLP
jgi:histone acetyltransferase (RNA polymerase elongator complex component)